MYANELGVIESLFEFVHADGRQMPMCNGMHHDMVVSGLKTCDGVELNGGDAVAFANQKAVWRAVAFGCERTGGQHVLDAGQTA